MADFMGLSSYGKASKCANYLLRGNLMVGIDGRKGLSVVTALQSERLVLGAVDRGGLTWALG